MPIDPQAGERAARGARCRALLESEPFKQAVDDIKVSMERRILTGKLSERDEREEAFLEYHALKRVLAQLHRWVEDGDLAAQEIERDQ